MISVKDAQGVTYDAAKHFGVYGLQKITEYRDALTAAAIFQMKRRFRCMKKVVQPSVNPSGMKGIGGKPKR